jgi:magnesium transporter
MLDLRLAMIDFKGQMNMRLFTNMTIIVAPLSVITGWFGMNFEDMKELSIEGFYYGVVVFAVLLVTCLSLMLVWLNRDRAVSAQDAAEAQVVLRKAEAEED